MCSLCRLPVAKKHNFGHILTFGRLLYYTYPISPMRAKFSALQQTHGIHLRAKFHLDRSLLSPFGGEKKTILPFLDFDILWCRQLAAIWQSWTRAHLQTFPYPTTSKSFLFSNAFLAKSGVECLTVKSVTNKQTDRQTKTQRFGCSGGGEIRASPNLVWWQKTSSTFLHFENFSGDNALFRR